jgi:hypothetical protein
MSFLRGGVLFIGAAFAFFNTLHLSFSIPPCGGFMFHLHIYMLNAKSTNPNAQHDSGDIL